MTFPAGMMVKNECGKPLVVHFHATEFDRAGESGSPDVYAIEREAIKESDAIVAVSKWTSKILSTKYAALQSKLHAVHNGIAPTEHPFVRKKSPLGDKLVTFLGRVTFQKGPEYFVAAAKKVLERFPDCHFVMAGSGDALPRMITTVAKEGMSSQFHFTGFLNKDEIGDLLAISTVYVMPSVSEPFGITPLEAIQAGVPVIVSRQSGVSEVIDHLIKVDFWNVDELADAISSVLTHESLANTLRHHAKENITNISWQAAANKIKHIYYETVTN
jgi:glycosyltransferase involved in cell wall biosynthesis